MPDGSPASSRSGEEGRGGATARKPTNRFANVIASAVASERGEAAERKKRTSGSKRFSQIDSKTAQALMGTGEAKGVPTSIEEEASTPNAAASALPSAPSASSSSGEGEGEGEYEEVDTHARDRARYLWKRANPARVAALQIVEEEPHPGS